jgi:hypothetical protein
MGMFIRLYAFIMLKLLYRCHGNAVEEFSALRFSLLTIEPLHTTSGYITHSLFSVCAVITATEVSSEVKMETYRNSTCSQLNVVYK